MSHWMDGIILILLLVQFMLWQEYVVWFLKEPILIQLLLENVFSVGCCEWHTLGIPISPLMSKCKSYFIFYSQCDLRFFAFSPRVDNNTLNYWMLFVQVFDALRTTMFILGMISVFIGISLLAPDESKGMFVKSSFCILLAHGENMGNNLENPFRMGNQGYSTGFYSFKSS